MSWGAYFEIDPTDALNLLGAVVDELDDWPSDDLSTLAASAAERIDVRTTRGLDMFGQPFTPYSESYVDWKRRHKELDEGDTLSVDLTLRGNMLAAMTPQVRGQQAVVGFSSKFEAMKAMAHHEGKANLPERPWFGIAQGSETMEQLQQRAARMKARQIEAMRRFG